MSYDDHFKDHSFIYLQATLIVDSWAGKKTPNTINMLLA